MALSHLKSLQALELALRLGSLQAAGRAMWITPAAVGQRIKALEDYLGIELVVRGRSGLRPTSELSGAIEHLRVAFQELDTVSALLNLQRGDEIHIAATSDFAELWLRPRLERFRTQHPHVLFCINARVMPRCASGRWIVRSPSARSEPMFAMTCCSGTLCCR